MAEKQQKDEQVEVVIAVDNHTHEGEKIKPGGKIKVTAQQREWLLQQKIIKG